MDTIQFILNGMMREALSPQTAAVAIAVIGLNIHFGFTGLLNMGQSGFMLLGAYGFAIAIWNGLPMVVFGMQPAGNILRVVQGEKIGTLVSTGAPAGATEGNPE